MLYVLYMYIIIISACNIMYRHIITVEPPNKGHFGDNINSAVVCFVERLSSSQRFKMH